MIVPEYWAEVRKQHRTHAKQITVRRYGWSDTSEADALAHAEARADEALRRVLAGDKLNRREPRVPYNGAEGVPIREEVLARHGDQVITRNSYGAHCLNSPNALFADIDFNTGRSIKATLAMFALLAIACVVIGLVSGSWTAVFLGLFVSLLAAAPLTRLVTLLVVSVRGGTEKMARARLTQFLAGRPTWSVRLYRTPAGYRVLATHQEFEATSVEAQRFFAAIAADPVYVRMCANQRCFRARLTAKPWRIGIAAHMRPRPGIWPVAAERLPVRNEWLRHYEVRAASFSACRYVESLGAGIVHESIRPVIELHDRESGALVSGAKLA